MNDHSLLSNCTSNTGVLTSIPSTLRNINYKTILSVHRVIIESNWVKFGIVHHSDRERIKWNERSNGLVWALYTSLALALSLACSGSSALERDLAAFRSISRCISLCRLLSNLSSSSRNFSCALMSWCTSYRGSVRTASLRCSAMTASFSSNVFSRSCVACDIRDTTSEFVSPRPYFEAADQTESLIYFIHLCICCLISQSKLKPFHSHEYLVL